MGVLQLNIKKKIVGGISRLAVTNLAIRFCETETEKKESLLENILTMYTDSRLKDGQMMLICHSKGGFAE